LRRSRRPSHPLNRVGAVVFSIALATALALALLPVLPQSLQVDEGDIASRTWQAPRDFSFESAVLTEKAREQTAQAVPDVLVFSSEVRSEQITKLEKLIGDIGRVRDSSELSRSQKLSALLGTENLLAPGFEAFILDMTANQWQTVSNEAKRVLEQLLSEAVPRDKENQIGEQLSQRLDPSLSQDEAALAELLVKPFIVPNLQVDTAKTEEARAAARAAVVPVRVSYTKGQTIVRSGEVIDSTAVEAMREAGLLSRQLEWRSVAAVVVVSIIAGGVLGTYVYSFPPADAVDLRRLLLLLTATALATLAAKLYLPLVLPDHDRHFLAYALPLAAIPMMLAALLETQMAIVTAAVLAALLTFIVVYLPGVSAAMTSAPLDALRVAGVYGFGSVAGTLAVHRAERLNRYLLAGIIVALVSMAMLTSAWFLDLDRKMMDFAWMGLAAVVSGSVAGILAAGAFVTLGSLFGITTRVQLMELAQLNQPLLRRLQDEAPGTFHHSVILGNLAERAADLIGADSLLVRVGCYFHDVGKLRQPGYFIENQMAGSNPHDQLDFRSSAQIVLRHVTDGVELAREHGLPSQVRDFISQHHGTGQATYFYRKAVEADEDVDPSQFTYPGPKPQSQEVAIVMLADSVEAAIRASSDRSPERIDALVDEVMAERLAEGQLDESDLTLREIKIAGESFKSTLRGVYHPRLEYPAAAEGKSKKPPRRMRLPSTSPSSPPKTR
jgi:putative nucleotidyltransferase with HDIG domain